MRLLEPHYDTIARVAVQYLNHYNGRVRWANAMVSEPELRDKLLVGGGNENAQVKRLSNFWMRRSPGGKERLKARRQVKDKSNGPPQTSGNRYANSYTSILDTNREGMMAIVRDYKKGGIRGGISWTEGLAANPALADAIGYSGQTEKEQRRLLTLIGFWHRNRNSKNVNRGSPKLNAVEPAVATPATNHRHSPRFCSNCGHSLAAESLATGIIASLSASGLTHDQIIDTLTRAAATVSRLAKP